MLGLLQNRTCNPMPMPIVGLLIEYEGEGEEGRRGLELGRVQAKTDPLDQKD